MNTPRTVANPGEIKIVNSWEEFRHQWSSRHNFILGKGVFPFQFTPPPLADVVDTVRQSANARLLKGKLTDDMWEKWPEFAQLPIQEALQARAQVAHFELLEFARPGGVLAGLENVFRQWYASLAQHGFSWSSSQRAFFHSSPNTLTKYHYDSSYVLAWQLVGTKRFCWLKDPERWCSQAVRRAGADRYETMTRPEGITPDDVIELEMRPGDVLWNVMLTPHWVYALDETTYSINITHFDLACDGRLSPIDLELRQTRHERILPAVVA